MARKLAGYWGKRTDFQRNSNHPESLIFQGFSDITEHTGTRLKTRFFELLSGTPPVRIRAGTPQKTPKAFVFQGFSALFFIYTCYYLTQIIYCGRSASLRLRTLYSWKILANQISKKTPFLLMKIAFLLIGWEIVLKILLIEMCAYYSPTLFYPVPFNPLVILC